jgi:hypothetical protein
MQTTDLNKSKTKKKTNRCPNIACRTRNLPTMYAFINCVKQSPTLLTPIVQNGNYIFFPKRKMISFAKIIVFVNAFLLWSENSSNYSNCEEKRVCNNTMMQAEKKNILDQFGNFLIVIQMLSIAFNNAILVMTFLFIYLVNCGLTAAIFGFFLLKICEVLICLRIAIAIWIN